MNPKHDWKLFHVLVLVALLAGLGVSSAVAAEDDSEKPPAPGDEEGYEMSDLLQVVKPVSVTEIDGVSFEMRQQLGAPVGAWLGERIKASKNEDGRATKRGTFSRRFVKQDDGTYTSSVHIDTAGETEMTTERYELVLRQEGKQWKVDSDELKDTYIGLRRLSGGNCYPFEKLSFDREGMTLSGTGGTVCESYLGGTVRGLAFGSADMKYSYVPPPHAQLAKQSHDAYALHKMLQKDHSKELVFDPGPIFVECDPASCEELLESSFTGLTRVSKDKRGEANFQGFVSGPAAPVLGPMAKRWFEERKESAFAHFDRSYVPGNTYYRILVTRQVDPFKRFGYTFAGPGVYLIYDNWGGFEVEFGVMPRRADIGEQLFGTVFGYYSAETIKNTDPYDLERRDDPDARWYEVHALNGVVEAALEDPEILKADLTFGITLKQDIQELPFYIASIPEQGATGTEKRKIYVNSVLYEGQELTWIKTGAISGIVVLPEVLPAGSKIDVRMLFATRAIYKENHAFSQMSRFGWMPFVRFGDFIDEFELTIKAPSQYEILGIGHKVDERVEGNVRISHWRADSPVVFPTLIFGKYISDTPGKYQATKLDGTVIPVEVHVDEVSMGQLAINVNTAETFETIAEFTSGSRGIREKQLRPIATQAAVSINLYKEVSGLDYPYGELNLVNDPAPALYGQAPSSLIYLGSLVFRGEGTIAGGGMFGGGQGSTRTAKFLKSVTAHEVGHQWWGSRVSNANGRNYWFVETLAEYFSALYLEQAFGEKEYQEQVDEWRDNILNARQIASVQNASALWAGEDGFRSYQAAVYSKGPYAFHMLRETFGDEKFFDFLKKFSMELAAKREIVTFDIQNAAEKALGGIDPEGNPYNVDLDWFFDQWIRGAGVPQYRFLYQTRQTEDGGWLIEGKVEQRVVVGSARSKQVLEETYYRGVVDITVDVKGGQTYERRLVVEGPETPFRLKVPEKPVEVALNKNGEILSHPVITNMSWD